MVPFAGYDMPVQYPDGVIKEHLHVRNAAGVFDVSHMGQIALHCPLAALARLVPSDLAALAPMQTVYSLLLNARGGVIDDLMITRLNAVGDRWFLVVNAGRKHVDLAHLKAQLPEAQSIILHHDRALIAVQGPGAAAVMRVIGPEAAALTFMRAAQIELPGIGAVMITRGGYTGEDGFEIALPNAKAEKFMDALLAQPGVQPAGLGARDTLRLEAGLCLYGHELDETISPVEAALNWVIAPARRQTADFPGAARIMQELQHGPKQRRFGLLLAGKAIAREGAEVLNMGGEIIGSVCSGGYSPTLDTAIAMGYLRPGTALGAAVQVMLRGRGLPAKIVKLPFVPHRYAR